MSPHVLILGNYRQSITVVRSLARAGYRIVFGSDVKGFADYSRHVSEVWRHPPLNAHDIDSERGRNNTAVPETVFSRDAVSFDQGNGESPSNSHFCAALQQFLRARPDIVCVFPVGEDMLHCLARHHQTWGPAIPVMPTSDIVLACLDKAGMYDLARKCGIPVADYGSVDNLAGLRSLAASIGYPCVIKPNDSLRPFAGRKAVICRGQDDVEAGFPQWPEGNRTLLVQQFAFGYRHNCHLAAVDGNLLMYFEQQVLRTDRIDDTGYGVDSISVRPRTSLRAHCERLMRAMNYSGVGCVQFLVDEHGHAHFLEMNPRLDATCALPFHCGYDFPRAAVECARLQHGRSQSLPTTPEAYPVGRRLHWLFGDLRGLWRARRSGELDWQQACHWLGQLGTTYLRADHHLTWSPWDPLPSGYLYGNWLGSFFSRWVGSLSERLQGYSVKTRLTWRASATANGPSLSRGGPDTPASPNTPIAARTKRAQAAPTAPTPKMSNKMPNKMPNKMSNKTSNKVSKVSGSQ